MDRPILFSGEMVRAILSGTKTMTRRPVKLREFGPPTTRGYDWTFRDRRGRAAMTDRYLDCPACGEPCRTLPAERPTPQYPWGSWEDGDRATCQCGAEAVVEVEDGVARLREEVRR